MRTGGDARCCGLGFTRRSERHAPSDTKKKEKRESRGIRANEREREGEKERKGSHMHGHMLSLLGGSSHKSQESFLSFCADYKTIKMKPPS